jgi:hypothetical protein
VPRVSSEYRASTRPSISGSQRSCTALTETRCSGGEPPAGLRGDRAAQQDDRARAGRREHAARAADHLAHLLVSGHHDDHDAGRHGDGRRVSDRLASRSWASAAKAVDAQDVRVRVAGDHGGTCQTSGERREGWALDDDIATNNRVKLCHATDF